MRPLVAVLIHSCILTACARDAVSDAARANAHADVSFGAGDVIAYVEAAACMSIGDRDAAEHALFHTSGALRLRDGSIAVAQQSKGGISVFDFTGTYTHTIGRDGEGPGEFRRITRLFRGAGDSLVAWDPILGRMSIHDPHGTYVRAVHLADLQLQISGPLRTPEPFATLTNGRFAVVASAPPSGGPGWVEDGHGVFLADSAGRIADTVTTALNSDRLVSRVALRTGSITASWWPTYSRVLGLARLHDELFVNDGSQDIRVYSSDGQLLRTLRADLQPRALTRQHIEDYAAHACTEPACTDAILNAPPREQFPTFRRIHATHQFLWLEQPTVPTDSTRRWIVIRPGGQLVGTVVGPVRGRVLDIDEQFMLLHDTDDTGVEVVRVCQLRYAPM